jgi:hypothetical protein
VLYVINTTSCVDGNLFPSFLYLTQRDDKRKNGNVDLMKRVMMMIIIIIIIIMTIATRKTNLLFLAIKYFRLSSGGQV